MHIRRISNSVTSGFLFLVLLTGGALLAPGHANAQVEWLPPGADDWYIGPNWSSGSVPTSVDLTIINNGGEAIADRTSGNFTTDPQTGELNVGRRTDPTLGPPDSTGVLNLLDVDLDVNGPAYVGVVQSLPGMFLSANGAVGSTAGVNAPGRMDVDGDFFIGVVWEGDATAVAGGLVDLSGALAGNESGNLRVGQMLDGGVADGDLLSASDVSGFDVVNIGGSGLSSTGDSTGDLIVGGSLIASAVPAFATFQVGTQAGDGIAVGNAQIGTGVFGFGFAAVASGSTAGSAGASGTGVLNILSGGLITTDGSEFAVGATNGPGDQNGTASIVGDVSGYSIIDIGWPRQSDTTGNASGSVNVTGSVTGLNGTGTFDDLVVGNSSGSSIGDGDFTVGGDVSGFADVNIGGTGLNSTGDADGELVIGGSLTASTGPNFPLLQVGTQAGDGVAVGSAQIGTGVFGFDFVAVASGSTAGSAGASGTGVLNILSGGLTTTAGSEFAVGATNGPGDQNGTASIVGDVSGYSIIDIGWSRQSDTTGNASGSVSVTGSATGLNGTGTFDDLVVGRATGSGNGTGSMDISDGFSGFSNVRIGHCDATATGNADGALLLSGGSSSAVDVLVGNIEGACGAVGLLALQPAMLATQSLGLGTGSTLAIDINGTQRGVDYGAIDAGTASLDGALEVTFNTDAEGVFDLIVTDSGVGISGDFSSVNLVGLAPGVPVSAGIELVDLGSGPVAVYRISVGNATFEVSKDFDDDNPMPVEVTFSCNTGIPLQQTTMITEGNPVTFIINDYQPGTLECEVTEVVPVGYAVNYVQGEVSSDTGCLFTDVSSGDLGCVIENTLLPVDVEVTKTWIDDNPQFQSPYISEAAYACVNQQFGDAEGTLNFNGNPDTQSFSVFPHWDGTTNCTVTEDFVEGGVETNDDDCEGLSVAPGQGASCEIVNTRLYEGIPTLGRSGLLLLVLLMMAVGMVAVRRY